MGFHQRGQLIPLWRLSRSPPGQFGQACYPCTGAASLMSMSHWPRLTRPGPAEFPWMVLASWRILGGRVPTSFRIANIFQDLLLPAISGYYLMRQTGRKFLAGQLGPGPGWPGQARPARPGQARPAPRRPSRTSGRRFGADRAGSSGRTTQAPLPRSASPSASAEHSASQFTARGDAGGRRARRRLARRRGWRRGSRGWRARFSAARRRRRTGRGRTRAGSVRRPTAARTRPGR
jgi:hypothetical protein